MIKGITVVLYERTETGTDDAGATLYAETPVEVKNVLVTPISTEDIVSDIQLYGKKGVYELCLPKGDTHRWEDSRVDFFGTSWRVYGYPKTYIAPNIPLVWNTKWRVERYG